MEKHPLSQILISVPRSNTEETFIQAKSFVWDGRDTLNISQTCITVFRKLVTIHL